MTNNTKDSFILYTEQIELFQELSNEQAGELIKGIFDYVKTGILPEFTGMSKMAFITIRQMLDRNAEKYEEKREKMSQNGKKGGRPPLNKSKDDNETKKVSDSTPAKSLFSLFKPKVKTELFNKKDEPPVNFSDIVKQTQPEFYEKIMKHREKNKLINTE